MGCTFLLRFLCNAHFALVSLILCQVIVYCHRHRTSTVRHNLKWFLSSFNLCPTIFCHVNYLIIVWSILRVTGWGRGGPAWDTHTCCLFTPGENTDLPPAVDRWAERATPFRQKRCLFLQNFPPATHRFTCNSVSLSLTKLLHFNIHTILVSNLRYDTMLSFPYHINLKPYFLDLLRVTFLRVCLDAVTRSFKEQCAWKGGRGGKGKGMRVHTL